MSPVDDALEQVQLTHRFRLWQRRQGHRSSTDDILCAWAGHRAAPRAMRVLDLGCGHGAVTLMLAGVLPAAHLVAVEAQAVSHELLVRNVAENGLADRVTPINADIRTVDLHACGPFELVTGTPPFMPLGSGSLPRDAQRAAARFELRGGIEAYLAVAARHLAPEGVVSLLMDGAQDDRCRRAIADAGLVLMRRISIAPHDGARVRFIAYQAGGAARGAPHEDRIEVRKRGGSWTPEFRELRRTLGLPQD